MRTSERNFSHISHAASCTASAQRLHLDEHGGHPHNRTNFVLRPAQLGNTAHGIPPRIPLRLCVLRLANITYPSNTVGSKAWFHCVCVWVC